MYRKEIEEYIDSHKDQMIEDICTLCRINSEKMPYTDGAEHISFMHWILIHSVGKCVSGYRMEKKLQTAAKQQKNCMNGI